jgi:hypothetical protein
LNGVFMAGVVCLWRTWWLKKDIERIELDIERMELEIALLEQDFCI